MTAQRMSKATLTTYSAAVGQLDDFLAAQDMPRAVVNIGREHLEAFIADLLGTWKPDPRLRDGRSPQRMGRAPGVRGPLRDTRLWRDTSRRPSVSLAVAVPEASRRKTRCAADARSPPS